MNLKNILLAAFCKFFIRRKTNKTPPSRILIVSTTALGDTLWATPAIESLKKSNPNAFLAVLTSSIGNEVLKTNPWIDAIFLLKKPFLFNVLQLWRPLRKANFDTIIVFHASQRLVFPLISLLGAQTILGTEKINKGLDSLFTDLLPAKYQHEIVRRLELVQKIGSHIHTEHLVFIPDSHAVAPFVLSKPYIILHPGAKDPFKRWPEEHFAFIGRYLLERGYPILISGNSDEKKIVENVASQIPGSTIIPPSSLHSFAKLLQNAHLLITNDSGPLHLAAALRCKAIAIYGPTDPNLCGPHKMKNIQILTASPTCSPCFKKNCRRPFCLFQTSPQEMILKLKSLI